MHVGGKLNCRRILPNSSSESIRGDSPSEAPFSQGRVLQRRAQTSAALQGVPMMGGRLHLAHRQRSSASRQDTCPVDSKQRLMLRIFLLLSALMEDSFFCLLKTSLRAWAALVMPVRRLE